MLESHVFVQLLIVLGSVTVVTTLCHYLKLPTIVGFIAAGITVGPSGLGLVASLPNADAIAEVAIVFLMFTIGLEFSFRKLFELRREFLRLGLAQVALTVAAVALIAASVFGMSWGEATFCGFLMALSSTALVMKLLGDARDLETPYGKNAVSILLFQDLAVIPMMLALPFLAGRAGTLEALAPAQLGASAGTMLSLLLGLWLISRYVVPFVLARVVATRSREVFFFCVLFFCLGTAYAFRMSGLSLALGAFAAGLMISEGPYDRQVTADILPLRDNFLGLFFASVGMLLDLRFLGAHALAVIGIGLGLFLVKTGVVASVALLNRLPLTIAQIMGLILAQVGEFSFILATRGHDLGLLGDAGNQYFLSVSVLSMVATPFLFRLAPRLALARPTSRWRAIAATTAGHDVRDQVKRQTGHTIIVGFGITGQNVAAALDALAIPYRAIELNYEAVKTLSAQGVPIDFGDATRVEVLEHAGLKTARLVIIAVSGARLLAPILAAVRSLRPDVQVIVRSQYVRDIESLRQEPLTDILVAEIETAVELMARALRIYGVSAEEIRHYMENAHRQLQTFAQLGTALRSPLLSLPSWEALSAIRPLRVLAEYCGVGKSLAGLSLRTRAGASVVSVFREGLGTTIPGGDFVLAAGDVVHLIGSPEALAAAERVLRDG
jgi:CPA2 family monovalent cation:H+ antiporter-2